MLLLMLFFPARCCGLVEKAALLLEASALGQNLCDCQMYLGIAQKSLDLFYPTNFSLFIYFFLSSFYSFNIKKVDFSHVCNLRGSRLKIHFSTRSPAKGFACFICTCGHRRLVCTPGSGRSNTSGRYSDISLSVSQSSCCARGRSTKGRNRQSHGK